ncbi:microcystin-dependent protein [Bacillus ectoiniformans]|uniref:phage tail protein n=1 Tax=Bacillus ectoiniformans TaxID=1494429 RepID=UPI00195EC840|nr:tail fiber protein [Bacillus ectoiniformans]MBM7647790.1 microcystin-dependent protein [Bacillus ectoiniformans]
MDAFIGEIRPIAGNFAPRGWALCNGQLLTIAQNTTLFSIIGIMYGGDGITNFALPNLQGRAVMQQGSGQGLTPRTIGQGGGTTTVTLIESEIPSHSHVPSCNNATPESDPTNGVWADVENRRGYPNIYSQELDVNMAPNLIEPTGGTQSHNNMQPYLGLNFIICVSDGEYPVRS